MKKTIHKKRAKVARPEGTAEITVDVRLPMHLIVAYDEIAKLAQVSFHDALRVAVATYVYQAKHGAPGMKNEGP